MNDKISKARTQLVLDHPFFGSLALRLKLVEDQTFATAYTDGKVMGYNPAFIDTLSLAETKWLIAHEVMHLACLHHVRRKNREFARWNQATDYAINGILQQAGLKNPPGILLNDEFKDKSAEAIYILLAQQQEPGNNNGNFGEVRDAPADSKTEAKQTEADYRVQLAQACQQAKAMGNLPECIKRLVQETLYPVVNWRELLRHFVEETVRKDYSWLYPSRRYMQLGLCLPGLHSKELGQVIVAIDTSGSIDQKALTQFCAEVSAVLEAFDAQIDVLFCNNRIQGHQQFGREDLPLNLKPKGGGGTDFIPVFDWVAEQGTRPACVVYLTDLRCSRFPKVHPDYPVLWVQTGRNGYQPPFGSVIQMQ